MFKSDFSYIWEVPKSQVLNGEPCYLICIYEGQSKITESSLMSTVFGCNFIHI